MVAAFTALVAPTRRFIPDASHLGPCLAWQGPTNPGGYGVFTSAGYSRTAAHAFALLLVERRRPPGFLVDHLCHSYATHCLGGPGCPHRACVNPAHLEYVSRPVSGTRQSSVNPYNDARMRRPVVSPWCVWGHPYLPGCFHYEGRNRVCHVCTGDVVLGEDWRELAASGYRLG